MSDEIRDQINDILEGEIQNNINEYLESEKTKSDDKGKENVVDADFEDVKEDKEKSA